MTASLTFFPVDNGDMALIKLDNGQHILIDVNIRAAADNPDDDTYDVATDLKDRLPRDDEGRLYVDVFLLSHPDGDHITGLRQHFHLGPTEDFPADNKDDLILIREMWSSPIVFRRASVNHKLIEDAKAWNKEARRRVALFRKKGFDVGDGDRILLMGKDKDGKTDDIMDIVVEQYGLITRANQGDEGLFEGRLLAPTVVENDDELIDLLEKNNSSVIIRFSITGDGYTDMCRFLTGGDAGVAIWERLWNRLDEDGNTDWLTYDVMETPHHCSWRSLSYDRWSELGEKVKVCEEARSALSQVREGAVIVASCKPIKKDDSNPPHERAKREFVSILEGDSSRFICTSEYSVEEDRALEFKIYHAGTAKKVAMTAKKTAATVGVSGIGTAARAHGRK
ncbi:hypothetical protein SAMCCGM7_pB0248 (plasmid) [Sinorhizobium americanum CCGM7]|uniref:hypothetical protein n=1 Tax=Sinorhizobium americanum TaxID=194963 RepID=UPI00055DA647|nr:hypothetical protein [Sinorhizobium americanum]APG86963.1 hypothetical protein SAMCCGM7_pB0248 [Sinorhizobium americanum CCGM7]